VRGRAELDAFEDEASRGGKKSAKLVAVFDETRFSPLRLALHQNAMPLVEAEEVAEFA
jgi:hypothetical protein